MGIINHNAIIATTWSYEKASELQSWIDRELSVEHKSLITCLESSVNTYTTFVLGPDGSKEGWPESDQADELRARLIKRLSLDDYEDGSSPWNFVEVGYGEYGQKILSGNCANCFNDKEYAEDVESLIPQGEVEP